MFGLRIFNTFFKVNVMKPIVNPSFSGSYRDVIDNMNLALAIYRAVDNGEDFIFVEVNSGVEEIEQVKRDDLIGKRVTKIFPGVEAFGLLDVFKRVNETGIPERHPISFYEDDRIAGWRDNYIYKLDSGEIVAVYRDETERKQMEEETRKSRDEKNAIIEGSADPIIVNDEERVLFLNQKAVELFGYSDSDKMIGKPFIKLFSNKHQVQIKERAQRRLEGKDVPDQYDSTIERLDGTIVPVEFHLSLIEYDGTRAILNIIRDITDRKHAEEALRVSEAKYRSFLDESLDGVTVNVSGELVYVNPRFSEMIGYSAEELIGSSILDLHAPQYRDMILDRTLRRGKGEDVPTQYEVELVRKVGSLLPVSYSVSRIIYEGQPSSLTFIRDITQRRKSEKDLEEQVRLSQTLIDQMPCVAMLLKPTTREVIASNQAARDVGAVPGEHCFATFGQREDPCPFCLASKVWAGLGEQHLIVDALNVVWDAYWIPITDDLYMHYAFDITEKHRREGQLVYQANILQNISDGIISTDLDYNILSWNKGAERIYGYIESEVKGKNVASCLKTST